MPMDSTNSPDFVRPNGHTKTAAPTASELSQLRKQLTDTQERLEQTQRELDAIRTSSIWRASLVLRAPVMLLLRLRHGWRLIPGEVARRGGWPSQIAEWWREVRAYGWGYFKRAASYELNPSAGSGPHDRSDYRAWTQKFGTCYLKKGTQADLGGAGPLLSVVMPVYRPPIELLKQAVGSVKSQSYTRWELCIADDASGDEALTAYLQDLTSQHPNIHVALRQENGHISSCTNSALALASGEFVVLLDQDDLLPSHALQRVAECIAKYPDAGIIYSDEDRVDETGQQPLGAYFKPDFNYDLFLGHNLISHLGVYRRSLIEKIGGFRLGLEGSQDWDLALRALEQLKPEQVVHIPEVLYHWRAIEGSTALAHSEKAYTSTAARQAVKDHLNRIGVPGEVVPSTFLPSFNRVRYGLPPTLRTATLILVFDYPADQLKVILSRLWQQRGDLECDAIVVTTHPVQDKELLPPAERGHFSLRVIQAAKHASLSERINSALPLAQGHFVALVTIPLIQVSNGWLEELCRIAGLARVGFTGPRIVDKAGHKDIFDHGGVVFTDTLRAVHAHKGLFTDMTGYAGRGVLQQSFTALSPALLVIKRSHLTSEAQPITHAFGGRIDLIDKCLHLHHQGLHNVWTPEVEVGFNDLRFAGKANVLSELGLWGERRQAWIAKWGREIQDSAYNPNLSRDGDFALRWRD